LVTLQTLPALFPRQDSEGDGPCSCTWRRTGSVSIALSCVSMRLSPRGLAALLLGGVGLAVSPAITAAARAAVRERRSFGVEKLGPERHVILLRTVPKYWEAEVGHSELVGWLALLAAGGGSQR